MGSGDDHLGTETGERMGGMATAKGSANRYRAEGVEGTELGAQQAVDAATVRRLIAEWPAAPKKTAEKLIEHYGPPNEATPTKVFGTVTVPGAGRCSPRTRWSTTSRRHTPTSSPSTSATAFPPRKLPSSSSSTAACWWTALPASWVHAVTTRPTTA